MAKVLVVDDSKLMRESLKSILEDQGHEVVGFAENGKEAYVKYKECQPDVVTMDVNMPEMDGITASKNITHHDKNAKVVFVTSYDDENIRNSAVFEGGGMDYIIKPFEADQIKKAVASCL